MLENRRFGRPIPARHEPLEGPLPERPGFSRLAFTADALPKLTYPGNYPKHNNYHMSYISVKNNMLRILLTRSGFPVYYM